MYYFAIKLVAAAFALICCLLSPAVFGQAMLPVADMKQDVDVLRRIVEESHPNPYRSVDKKLIEANWARAFEQIRQPMSKREFLNFVAPLLTQYRDGHTSMDLPIEADFFDAYVGSGGKFLPFSVQIIENRLYISASHGDASVAAGSEILQINGKTANRIVNELRLLTMGDNDAGRDVTLARLFGLYLWQKYELRGPFNLKLRLHGSPGANKVTVSGIDWDTYSEILFAGDPVRGYEFTPQVYVLEVNKMQARDAVKKQIDEIFASIKTKRYTHLVIDLRKNGGGSSVVGDWVMNYVTRRSFDQGGTKEVKISGYLTANNKFYAGWLPKLKERFPVVGDRLVMKFEGDRNTVVREKWVFPGKVVMLTSPRTYSSGFMMAEAFKCYRMGQLIGESPGSFRNLSGEMMQFKLPKSGLIGYVAAAQFKPPCYQKEPSDFLQTDLVIQQSLEDLAVGRDTALEFVKKEAAAK